MTTSRPVVVHMRPKVAYRPLNRLPRGVASSGLRSACHLAVGFGLYAIAMGVLLSISPNAVLEALGFPPTHEPWVHVIGAMAIAVGFNYVAAGSYRLVPFLWASVFGRLVFSGVVAATAFAWGAWPLVLFVGIDAVTACLTGMCLVQGGDAA